MWSRRFLQCIDDNILIQVVKKLTRGGGLLDIVLAGKEGLVEGIRVGAALAAAIMRRQSLGSWVIHIKQQVGLQPRTSGGLPVLFKKLLREIPVS